MTSYLLDYENMPATNNDNKRIHYKTNSSNENDNDNFIASPKGTKPFPFIKKCRTIAKRNKTILITIPQEICHLLKIEEGDNFNVYCDIESKKIIAEKLS